MNKVRLILELKNETLKILNNNYQVILSIHSDITFSVSFGEALVEIIQMHAVQYTFNVSSFVRLYLIWAIQAVTTLKSFL